MSINQNRPVIRYENIALIQSDVSGYNLTSNSGENLSFLPLVQSIDFSASIERTNIGSLGTKNFIDQSTRNIPNVRLSINTIEDFGHLFSNLVSKNKIKSDLNTDSNFYAYIAPNIGLDSKEDNQGGQFLSFGNCFLTSAIISQSINGFINSNYSFVGSNFQAEEVKPFYVDPSNIVYTGVSVPALDLMGDQSQSLTTEISGISKYYTEEIGTIIPSYSTDVIISGEGSVGNFLIKSESVQSFNINLNVNRKPIFTIGKKYPLTRKALFPSECSFSFSFLVSNFETSGDRANLKDFLNSDESYTLIISGKNLDGNEFSFRASEAKISSQSNNSSIQANISTSLSFSFELNKFTTLEPSPKYTIDFHGDVREIRNITTPLTYTEYYGDDSSLTKIYIGTNVPSIGNQAFIRCTSLEDITIPDSITSIGNEAFRDCSSLTSVIIPNSVSAVGIGTFFQCANLTSAALPNNDNFTDIKNYLFYKCTSLANIAIPDSVTSIGNGAFQNCDLTSIIIPDSVSTIGIRAFQGCDSAGSLTLPNNLNFTNIPDFAFAECKVLSSVIIPDTVETIGENTFRNLDALASITIPSGITSIGEGAFEGCDKLFTVNCNIDKYYIDNPGGVPANNVFLNTPSGLTINAPLGLGWTAGNNLSVGGNDNVNVNIIS